MNAKRHTLSNALRVAAEEYTKAAAVYKVPGAPYPGGEITRLGASFDNQASEAIRLAEAIEQADTIRLED